MAAAGAGFRQAEHLRRLRQAELFEVAQGQNLAVKRLHGVERLLQSNLQLGANGGHVCFVSRPKSCAASAADDASGSLP